MDWKISFLFVALVMSSGMAAGEVYYDVDADEDKALLNTTVRLECDDLECPVNSWSVALNKPEGADVEDVEAVKGEISDYQIRNGQLLVQTGSTEPTRTEVINIVYRINEDAEEVENGLYERSISLPGFPSQQTSGVAEVENLIMAHTSYGFQTQTSNNTFKFQGEGPTRLRLSFGDGHKTSYFEFFGDRPEETDLAYKVPAGTLGFAHRSERLPVAVLPNEEYNRSVNRWSSGRYVDGIIFLREDLEQDFLPVLAHESVHAFNEQRLDWDQTSSSWFDEGVAKYIESLVRNATSQKPGREVFGDEVSYVKVEDGDRFRYSLPSRGSKEQLWQYYQQDKEFMEEWDSGSEPRDFGYAYSELIIRNYVSQNNTLKDLYEELEGAPKIEDNGQKWSYYSDYIDLRPCDYNSREKFERCLERINEYNYPVYTASQINRTQKELQIEEVEVPSRNGNTDTDIIYEGSKDYRGNIPDAVLEVLEKIRAQIRSLIASL